MTQEEREYNTAVAEHGDEVVTVNLLLADALNVIAVLIAANRNLALPAEVKDSTNYFIRNGEAGLRKIDPRLVPIDGAAITH